jgi:O-methyltransferase involved in polyketide biosynthesis
MDNGQVRWFDLDLPDAIALRRQFFGDEPRCTMLAASVVELDWMTEVARVGGPVMFVSEAVLIYLDTSEARRAIEQIAAHFETFWLAVDTTSRSNIAGQARGGPMKQLPRESWFRWECNDPRVIEGWVEGLTLVESKTFGCGSPRSDASVSVSGLLGDQASDGCSRIRSDKAGPAAIGCVGGFQLA